MAAPASPRRARPDTAGPDPRCQPRTSTPESSAHRRARGRSGLLHRRLVERPGEVPHGSGWRERLDLVRRAVRSDQDAETICSRIIATGLGDESVEDDVAVIAMRRTQLTRRVLHGNLCPVLAQSTRSAREMRTSSMSSRAWTRRSTMSSIRCSSRSSSSASRRRAMRASERLVYWSSCWTTGSPSAPAAASSVRCLSSSCRTRSTTGSPLPSSAAVVVDGLDGRVEGEHLGELELLGDRVVDRQPREPHHRRQQQRLQQGQHDHAAGDQHDQVPVRERRARVQRVRHGEHRGERDGAAEAGHRAHRALTGTDPPQPLLPGGGRASRIRYGVV